MSNPFCLLVSSLLALTLIGSLVASTELACRNANKLIGVKKITKKDKNKLLEAHNKYRNLIASGKDTGQPPAQNMRVLTWDAYAEERATHWASTCKLRTARIKNKYNHTMGLNLYAKTSTKLQDVNTTFNEWADEMLTVWYNQVNNYEFGSNITEKTEFYTQMVWATTSKLGCGYSYFKKGDSWKVGYLVCFYDPRGNKWNSVGNRYEPPYIKGKVNCSAYDLNRSKKYKSLCVEKNY
uniref:Antigen5-like protein n=1 Tax=Triatoma matogrossensis TaxID=162370 RepID=E2J7B0_9HEMI